VPDAGGRVEVAEWCTEAEAEIAATETLQEWEAQRVRLLGKQGRLTAELKALSGLPPEARRVRGALLNRTKARLEEVLASQRMVLAQRAEQERLQNERLDMTLPGVAAPWGTLHPVSAVRRRLQDAMVRLGFTMRSGPEIETEWYNFEALNMPANHPAREMHDTFYVESPYVLRTHTSPVQVRAMREANGQLPLWVATLGFTYRRDDDATHLPQFMQMEGLVVDRGIGLPDLKGVVLAVVREVFGPTVRIRLRPSYFPFTEPSAEVDMSCPVCGGDGCRICHTGWIEVLGSGLVHPHVLRAGGYDPDQVSGFAFGWGVERVAMLLYGLDELRPLYQNDLRFLSAFAPWER
jgi:phenylalanyl-tRNA synthetase alpha chain